MSHSSTHLSLSLPLSFTFQHNTCAPSVLPKSTTIAHTQQSENMQLTQWSSLQDLLLSSMAPHLFSLLFHTIFTMQFSIPSNTWIWLNSLMTHWHLFTLTNSPFGYLSDVLLLTFFCMQLPLFFAEFTSKILHFGIKIWHRCTSSEGFRRRMV